MLGLLANKWTAGVLGIALLGGAFWYMSSTIEDQRKEISSLSTQIESQERLAKELQENITELSTQSQTLGKRMGELNTKLDNKVSGLEKMIGRGDVVAKKPKLVEKKINTSYQGFSDNADCIMGAKKCK
ncbi:hypothetical protein Ah1_00291 [Aeromonas phage Ah1]|uniref:Uncharacterized protein n=1 Tax=Aeromonas phage Ah1 TaxID=2053701 RepID=A0A2H4YF57_9CAUD|nr:Rz-like spanin [Aeromonas phage Ah1]AUE22809.1 hypothetical protein Ah1_00291 [Aeromonas phage Ah1]